MIEVLRLIFIGTCYICGAAFMIFLALILIGAIVFLLRNK